MKKISKVLFSKQSLVLGLFVLMLIGKGFSQEKVVLKTDRDIYVGGESMWLTVNCYNSNENVFSPISKVAYIELLNQANSPVLQLKMLLPSEGTSCLVHLPDTLSTGNYLIRSYTNWMRNLNPELYFSKKIVIINPFVANKYPEKEFAFGRDTVLYYFEGDQAVFENNNQMLIRTIDQSGQGISVPASIFSPEGEIVSELVTDKNGFSKIDFKPTIVGDYQFKFTDASKQYVFPIHVNGRGFGVLHLVHSDEVLEFSVLNAENNTTLTMGKIHIVTPAGKLLLDRPIALSSNSKTKIERSLLPSGILCALLINAENKIVSSRYFFLSENDDNKKNKIELNKSSFRERELVEMNLVNNSNLTNVSVSVVKGNLSNNVLPNTELRHLHSCFESMVAKLVTEKLSLNDLLLMFKPVNSFFTEELNVHFSAEPYGEVIFGVLKTKETSEPIANEKVMLSFVGQIADLQIAETDSLGKFHFEVNQCGEKEFVIQPYFFDREKYEYTIDLEQGFSKKYLRELPPLAFDRDRMKELNQCIVNMQISTLLSPVRAKQIDNCPTRPFYGEPQFVIPVEKFIDLPTMEDIIREIVTSVYLRKKNGKLEIRFVGNSLDNNDAALVMVDGVPVWDHDEVLRILPEELLQIEVINEPYFMSDLKLGSILNIITKKANLSSIELDHGIFRQAKTGYAKEWKYSGPDYSIDTLKNARIPDYRNTLYWNSNVDFQKSNQTTLSFYTGDENTRYLIIVEGVNRLGKLERIEQSFVVSNN